MNGRNGIYFFLCRAVQSNRDELHGTREAVRGRLRSQRLHPQDRAERVHCARLHRGQAARRLRRK